MSIHLATQPPPATQNALRGGPLVVHELLTIHDRAASSDGFGPPVNVRHSAQEIESRPTATPIPFNELIPSWNAIVPDGVIYQVELRVGRGEPAEWSDWYWFGPARIPGRVHRIAPITRDARGEVRTDCLILNEPHDRVQARIEFRPLTDPAAPKFRIDRFAIAISNTTGDKRLWDARRIKPKKWDPASYSRRLDVPFMTQHVQTNEMQGNICSPTSVAMVMAYRGVRKTPEEVARAAYDPAHKIYGNWPLNVQAACSFGVPGYVRRFATMDEAHAMIAQGQPIIASIRDPSGQIRARRASEGEAVRARRASEGGTNQLDGTPYGTTTGHLLVICGFDENGDVLVNDPAGRDAAHGKLTYDRAAFEQAWLGAGGVAYILEDASTRPDEGVRFPSSRITTP